MDSAVARADLACKQDGSNEICKTLGVVRASLILIGVESSPEIRRKISGRTSPACLASQLAHDKFRDSRNHDRAARECFTAIIASPDRRISQGQYRNCTGRRRERRMVLGCTERDNEMTLSKFCANDRSRIVSRWVYQSARKLVLTLSFSYRSLHKYCGNYLNVFRFNIFICRIILIYNILN